MRIYVAAALSLGAACLGAGPAGAQAVPPAGCTTAALADPPRQVLRCAGGLVIEAEGDAALNLTGQDAAGRPTRAELGGRAVLIELPRRRAGGRGFQILTPHAVASVRGTVYAVDVTPARTSVFVQAGRVAVARAGGRRAAAVLLNPGEGVDVEAGSGPLQARRWSPQRAAGLLARFGR